MCTENRTHQEVLVGVAEGRGHTLIDSRYSDSTLSENPAHSEAHPNYFVK